MNIHGMCAPAALVPRPTAFYSSYLRHFDAVLFDAMIVSGVFIQRDLNVQLIEQLISN